MHIKLHIMCIALAAILASCNAQLTQRAVVNYKVKATGVPSPNITSMYMEVGAGHNNPLSNSFSWMKYLGVKGQRLFIISVFSWKGFVGDRYGLDFNGSPVVSKDSWLKAVANLRSISKLPGETDFFDWLLKQEGIPWQEMLTRLEVTNEENAQYRQAGNPKSTLQNMQIRGMRPLVVWHVTCDNFKLSNSDATTSMFWQERWELYRWFYIGGRWLAKYNVRDIEPYNEPDLNEACLSEELFKDQYSIRSRGIQNAYSDFSAWKATKLKPNILAPTLATYKYSTYAEVAVKNIHRVFPNGFDPTWYNMNVYAYHQYGIRGKGLREKVDLNKQIIVNVTQEKVLKTALTEFSCSTSNNAEKKLGKELVDLPSYASCVAGQIAHMQGAVDWFVLYKFSQTKTSRTASGVIKTGIMFADNNYAPHDIGGSSKTAEAYRMLVDRSMGGKRMWDVWGATNFEGQSSKVYVVGDADAFYIYSVNSRDTPANMDFDMSRLPGCRPDAPVVVRSVSSIHHGEVSGLKSLSNWTLIDLQKTYSVNLYTIPRGNYAFATMYPTGSAYVQAGTRSNSNVYAANPNYLYVQTNSDGLNDNIAVSILSFDTGKRTNVSVPWAPASPPPPVPIAVSAPPPTPPAPQVSINTTTPGGMIIVPTGGKRRAILQTVPEVDFTSKMLSAVLSVRVSAATNLEAQIITVLGFNQPWNETKVTWSSLKALKPLQNGDRVDRIAKNFIQWRADSISDEPVVVGHVTVQPKSAKSRVYLDVTDYMKNGGRNFMFVRMWRKDPRGSDSSALAGDKMDGEIRFSSRKMAAVYRPRIDVVYKP